MNQPHQFEPVPALQLAEGTVVHSSARTSITSNLSPNPREGAQVCIGSARLEMTVGPAGALQVRYAVQALARLPARPLGRRAAERR